MPAILLLGAGGHAQACIDVIEQEGHFSIAGLVGLPQEIGKNLNGYPFLGTDADLPTLRKGIRFALVTVGQIKTPLIRMRLFSQLEQFDYSLPTIVSPYAYLSPHAAIGVGTIIMHGAIVNAGATIGRNCILNSQSLTEHGVKIADHCHIATRSVVNGNAKIGVGTFLGSGAVVRESTIIGSRSVIGMGQMVVRDVPDQSYLITAGNSQ